MSKFITSSKRIALVTGASGSIGQFISFRLASEGWQLILVGRCLKKLNKLRKSLIKPYFEQNHYIVAVDFLCLTSLRDAIQGLLNHELIPDLIINNAGMFYSKYGLTNKGYERTHVVNFYAPVLLTTMFLQQRQPIKPLLVANITSTAFYSLSINKDINNCDLSYSGMIHYAWSKLKLLYWTQYLITSKTELLGAIAVHPGTIRSNFASDESGLDAYLLRLLLKFGRSPKVASDRILKAIEYVQTVPNNSCLSLLGRPPQPIPNSVLSYKAIMSAVEEAREVIFCSTGIDIANKLLEI